MAIKKKEFKFEDIKSKFSSKTKYKPEIPANGCKWESSQQLKINYSIASFSLHINTDSSEWVKGYKQPMFVL